MNPHRKTIFISGIDTERGYQIVETFREDHQDLYNFCFIFGSLQTQASSNLIHTSITKTFQSQRDLAAILKLVMQCDLIILDLIEPTPDVQFILKTLHYQQKYEPISKRQVIIGISNFQTWMHTRPNIPNLANITKENYLQSAASGVIQPLTENQYLRRIPHPLFVYNYELENQILQLNTYYGNVQASVIACGVIYGKSSTQMHNLFENMLESNCIKCYGGGQNYIPFTRLDQMCEIVEKIAKQKTEKQYYVILDSEKVKQIELLEALRELSGIVNPIVYQQLKFLSRNELMFGCSILFESGSLQRNKSSILTILPQILSQFYEYTQYKPKKHIFILEETYQNKQKIIQFLLFNFTVVQEKQIKQFALQLLHQTKSSELMQETNLNLTKTINKKNSKQQSELIERLKITQHEISAIHSIIKKKILQNFCLLISSEFYETVIRSQPQISNQFQIIPLQINGQIFMESDLFLNKFNICQNQSAQQSHQDLLIQNQQIKEDNQLHQRVQNTELLQSRPVLDEITITQRNSTLSKRLSGVSICEKISKVNQQQSKKRQQYFLKQYLFDNVVVHVSEAIYQLKSNNQVLNLGNFIQKLKNIDERQTKILSSK